MTAIDFPDSPSAGQVFDKWTWNGTVWVLTDTVGWVDYTLAWSASTSNPALGNSQVVSRYRLDGDIVELYIYVKFGSTVNGGVGNLFLSIPFVGHAGHPEQLLNTKTYVPSASLGVQGIAYVLGTPGGLNIAPQFPLSASSSNQGSWRACDASAAAGTGIPQVAAAYSVQVNGSVAVHGRYRKA